MASDDPLSALEHLSQDFPKYSAALARKVNVPPKIRIKASQSLHRGQVAPAVYINGKAYRDPELNAYS
jgi:UDP-glucose:glycoprotein glucosyltransferase